MGFIRNYDQLATNDNRKIVLDLIEEAYASIQPKNIFKNHFSVNGNTLKIQNKSFNLDDFERIKLVGFGKGSAEMCGIIAKQLGDRLEKGMDIDVIENPNLDKIEYTLGTHPLPSEANIDYTKKVLDYLEGSGDKDLVLFVVCGGGSVLFEAPYKIDLATLTRVNDALLDSGATITEMNIIRRHLSRVKGGGLSKIVYPATVVALLFSDVPGNDLSVIASGPTVKDHTSLNDVKKILTKYKIPYKVKITDTDFQETPTDNKYFEKVHNILMVSNHTALDAMEKRARVLGKKSFILTDRLQGDARVLGQKLITETPNGQILFAGGESTIKITGKGYGGRNQALVLASLPYLKNETVIASFGSDGWDYYKLAGAIADHETLDKAAKLNLDFRRYLSDDDSYNFWQKTGDGIDTGHLESNVADLYIVYNS